MLIDELVTEACKQSQIERCDHRFSRRQVREFTGWGNTQLRLHFLRLEELEYLLIHRGGGGQSFVYELLYDGQGKDGKPVRAAPKKGTRDYTELGDINSIGGHELIYTYNWEE